MLHVRVHLFGKNNFPYHQLLRNNQECWGKFAWQNSTPQIGNIYIQMSTLTKLLRWVSQNYLLCFAIGSKILWFRFFFYWAQLFVDFVFKTIKTMKCFERNPQNNYKLIILILSNIYCSWMFVPLGVVKATKSTQKIEVYYFIVDHNK